MKIVILSGGVGSRLWPLSRKSCPKQYLNIFDGKSLFNLALERNKELSSDYVIVGNYDNQKLSLKELQHNNLSYTEIIEATPRNTAAAIAFASFSVAHDDILLVTPSDHIIEDVDTYHNLVLRATILAEQGYIVTFGVKPSKAETGYGYIESSSEDVISFHEKPNREIAEKFLKAENFYWNSGIFCFKAGVLLEELKKFEPQIHDNSLIAWNNSNGGKLRIEDMEKIPSKSIDYAVMERTGKMKVVKGNFGWSDLGSFESLYDYFSRNGNTPDQNGNMYIGNGKYTEFLGLSNTILVQTDDANLVLKKENSQEVKNIYEKLEKDRPDFIN